MARDEHASTAGPMEGPNTATPAGGYAHLGRQITRWTANLLATAAVLLILLLVGRQLTDTWQAATAPPTSNSMPTTVAASSGPTARNVAVDFGNQRLTMVRTAVSGDRNAALEALRRACAEASQEATVAGSPQPAEAALLDLIATDKPSVRLDDATEIHELAGAIPLTVVTKKGIATRVTDGGTPKVGAPQRRVITWGIALRTADSAWNVYALRPGGSATAAEGADDARPVPVPDGAVRILSVRERDAESVTAFRSATATPDAWRNFYDHWAAGTGLQASIGWKEAQGLWSGRFSRRAENRNETIDIQFGPDGLHGLRGLITQTRDTAAGGQAR